MAVDFFLLDCATACPDVWAKFVDAMNVRDEALLVWMRDRCSSADRDLCKETFVSFEAVNAWARAEWLRVVKG